MKKLIFFLLLAACTTPKKESSYIAFTGATIIDGNGGEPIRNGVLLLSRGRIVAVGTREAVSLPEGVEVRDVAGKFIMPGIINTHGHVGDVKGIEGGHYSHDNAWDNLSIYARYGVTTIVSLGGDKKDVEDLRGVNDTISAQHARLFIAGTILSGKVPGEVSALADSNHAMGVDIMKVRVDDNLGTAEKMPEEAYRAGMSRARDLGYKVATHIYYLDDAKKVIDAGTAIIAHSVRDLPVDDAFISLVRDRQVSYCPTLTRELSTFVYSDTAEFFSDPFFKKEYDLATIQPLLDPARQLQTKNSKSAQTYKRQLPIAMTNLKKLSDSGVIIVFGTDSGVPTRFMGYFEHIEMAMMAEAGLTPMQIIKSATKDAADALGLSQQGLGALVAGNRADFIILNADPLADIKNTRTIDKVFMGGLEVRGK